LTAFNVSTLRRINDEKINLKLKKKGRMRRREQLQQQAKMGKRKLSYW
jgi:hypothetical protein